MAHQKLLPLPARSARVRRAPFKQSFHSPCGRAGNFQSKASVPLRGAGSLCESRASTRPAGERVTSLLVQRSNQESTSRASTPQEELHKGYARGCRFHVQLGRTKLKGCALRMRRERLGYPERTSCTWNPQSAIQKKSCVPSGGRNPTCFLLVPFSLHEQRKGTRSLDASGNAQDAVKSSDSSAFYARGQQVKRAAHPDS